MAPVRVKAARKRNAASSPPPPSIPGSASAATAVPTGVDVWRMPSASPRSAGPNHDMTARPLAELTLAPAPPAAPNKATMAAKLDVNAIGTVSAAQRPRPAARTRRSPTRSASRPHGSSVPIGPTHGAAMTTPACVRLKPRSSRSAGARTAGAVSGAMYAACAPVPAARTAHRYRPRGRVLAATRIARPLQPERVERLRARRDEDALRLQIELERVETKLAAEP